jgi:hypothetical protein
MALRWSCFEEAPEQEHIHWTFWFLENVRRCREEEGCFKLENYVLGFGSGWRICLTMRLLSVFRELMGQPKHKSKQFGVAQGSSVMRRGMLGFDFQV